MSAAELQERPDVEIELVEQWRAQSLARVGYDPESAAVLAASHEVDLHYAMRSSRAAARSTSPSRSSSEPSSRLDLTPGLEPGVTRKLMEASCAPGRMRQHEPARLDSLARQRRLDVGPFTIHMYGLTLLAAIAICIWITGTASSTAAVTGISSSAAPSGASGRGSSGRGCTTSPRAGTRFPTSGGGRSRSGRAGSASGEGSRSAASSAV